MPRYLVVTMTRALPDGTAQDVAQLMAQYCNSLVFDGTVVYSGGHWAAGEVLAPANAVWYGPMQEGKSLPFPNHHVQWLKSHGVQASENSAAPMITGTGPLAAVPKPPISPEAARVAEALLGGD